MSPEGRAGGLAIVRQLMYSVPGWRNPVHSSRTGWRAAGTREFFAMTWTKPAFVEIKMDAEAKSYSAEALAK